MKKFHFLSIVLITVAFILEAVNIFLSNTIAAESLHAGKLNEQIHDLEQKNLLLRSELLEKTSYETIASRAAELGFIEPKNVISLNHPPKVAIKE